MTVAELIAALTEVPGDLEVYTEGCDCTGDVGSVGTENGYYENPDQLVVMLARKICSCERSVANNWASSPDCPVHGD